MFRLVKRCILAAVFASSFGSCAWWATNVMLEPRAQHLLIPHDHSFFKKDNIGCRPFFYYGLHGENGLLQDPTGRFIAFVDPINLMNGFVSLLIFDFNQPGWELQTTVPCNPPQSVRSTKGDSMRLANEYETRFSCQIMHPSLPQSIQLSYYSAETSNDYSFQHEENSSKVTFQTSLPNIVFCETREYRKPLLDDWPWARNLADQLSMSKWIDNGSFHYTAEIVTSAHHQTLWSHELSYECTFRPVAGITPQEPAYIPAHLLSQDKLSVLLECNSEQGFNFSRWELKVHSLWWGRSAGLITTVVFFGFWIISVFRAS